MLKFHKSYNIWDLLQNNQLGWERVGKGINETVTTS